MTNKTKNILWRVLQAFLIIAFNTATITCLVMNIIPVEVSIENKTTELSYWDCLTNKALYYILENKNDWIPQYHFYNKFIFYFFMGLGALISYSFIKFLYKNHREDKQFEKKQDLEEKRLNKILDKIEKKG